jgi:hypothetical protein
LSVFSLYLILHAPFGLISPEYFSDDFCFKGLSGKEFVFYYRRWQRNTRNLQLVSRHLFGVKMEK